MKTLAVLILVAAAYAGGYGYGRWYGKESKESKPAARKILHYVDPMHPAYKSDKPGIAPDCGMKLEPVYADGGPGATPEHAPGGGMPAGTVQVSPEKQQLIGVRWGLVEPASGSRTIRAVGKVSYDETRVARVHTRVEGWIEKVFVDFTGKQVEKGQPLLTIYSPDLLATQQEYLLALKAKDVMQHSTMAGVAGYSDSLSQAARRRLELSGLLSAAQIEEVARTRTPLQSMTVPSPITGFVVSRSAFPSQKAGPDTELYTIADLSRIWVMADVFEYEASQIRTGQAAGVTLAYYPGKTLRGTVSYIQPQVDPMTRTLKARIELDNPDTLLKPEMFADVEFRVDSGMRLSVPAEAVLDSGRVKRVFLDRGDGYFEPRVIETGERMGDRIEILRGLKSGDRVVTSGNFLIDSESQLKGAVAGMKHSHTP